MSFDCSETLPQGTALTRGCDWNHTAVWFLLEIGRNHNYTLRHNSNCSSKHGGCGTPASCHQYRTAVSFCPQQPPSMPNRERFLCSPLKRCIRGDAGQNVSELMGRTWSEAFKCLLIRPSTLFLRSRGALFHSTSNYFNPVIAPTAPGLTVLRVTLLGGHLSCPRGLVSMPSAPWAVQLWLPLGLLGLK